MTTFPQAVRQWLTVAQAAEYAGYTPRTMYRALEEGTLHGAQRVTKGTWRIRPECIDAWLTGELCAHQMVGAA